MVVNLISVKSKTKENCGDKGERGKLVFRSVKMEFYIENISRGDGR